MAVVDRAALEAVRAVDLSASAIAERKALKRRQDRVTNELALLRSRERFLRSKAKRMPGGNGRRTAVREANGLRDLAAVLEWALQGGKVQKRQPGVGTVREQRATEALNDLVGS